MNTIPLSLYIEIEEGKVADLEVVAKTALAWDALIKEIFYIADPSLEVRVEIVNGTKGSLSLNAVIKAISKVAEKNPKRAGVIIGLLAIFASSPAEHFSDHFWDQIYEILGHDHKSEPQPDAQEKQQIEQDAKHLAYGNVAVQQKKDVFAEALRDPSITGLGVSLEPGVRPPSLIKRAEFSVRAGKEVILTETVLRQTTYKTKPVTLIRPVLKAEAAMWRFEDSDGSEFSAKMKDPDYIEVLKSKTTGIPLAIGIEMIIEFEYKQEKIDGVWHNTEVSVRRVLSPKAGPADQARLF